MTVRGLSPPSLVVTSQQHKTGEIGRKIAVSLQSHQTEVTRLESKDGTHQTGVTKLKSPKWSQKTGVTKVESPN